MIEHAYVYVRRVHWGDNDPAGMVFTPRFLDFSFEAMEGMWEQVLGVNWQQMVQQKKFGSPMVHVDIDFMGAVRTGDDLHITVRVNKLGRSTIHYSVEGRSPTGEEKYRATMIAAMVDNEALKSIPIPVEMRERLEAYAEICRRG